MLVRGEAGVGKSALVREIAAHCPAQCQVFTGWGDDLTTPEPLGPFWDVAQESASMRSHSRQVTACGCGWQRCGCCRVPVLLDGDAGVDPGAVSVGSLLEQATDADAEEEEEDQVGRGGHVEEVAERAVGLSEPAPFGIRARRRALAEPDGDRDGS